MTKKKLEVRKKQLEVKKKPPEPYINKMYGIGRKIAKSSKKFWA